MTWLLAIVTATGTNSYPVIGDLAAHIAALPDDEPMVVTAMEQP